MPGPELSSERIRSASVRLAAQKTIREAEVRLSQLLQKRSTLQDEIHELRTRRSERRRGVDATALDANSQSRDTRGAVRNLSIRPTRSVPSLRRACRIALIETEIPETATQILARIARRNSFAFPSGINPVSWVMAELERLVLQGEAQLLRSNGIETWGWRRGEPLR